MYVNAHITKKHASGRIKIPSQIFRMDRSKYATAAKLSFSMYQFPGFLYTKRKSILERRG